MEPTENDNKAAGAPSGLNVELDADKRDAERYRWLRNSGVEGVIAPYTWWECGCKKEELDEAIDAAMAANIEVNGCANVAQEKKL